MSSPRSTSFVGRSKYPPTAATSAVIPMAAETDAKEGLGYGHGRSREIAETVQVA